MVPVRGFVHRLVGYLVGLGLIPGVLMGLSAAGYYLAGGREPQVLGLIWGLMGMLLLASWAFAFLVTTTPTQLSSPPPLWGGAARAWFRWVTNRPLRYGDIPISPLLRLFATGAALAGGGALLYLYG